MTAAFLRLLFIAAVTAYLLGLVLLARTFGWPAALGCSAGGLVLAVLLAEDWTLKGTGIDKSVNGLPIVKHRRRRTVSTLDEKP